MALKYDYKNDYSYNSKIKKVGEGKAKYEQAVYVVNEIMKILNEGKYNNLNDFIEKNSSLEEFLKNNPRIQTAIKHANNTFGNPLNETDYTDILNTLKQITEIKQSFDKESMNVVDLNEDQYGSMKIDDQMHYIDNSNSIDSIEEKMTEIQPSQNDFQTIDIKKNTENMFKDLESRQDGLNLQSLDEINKNLLTEEENELFQVAINYQTSNNSKIKIDLNKGIIVDEKNNIAKITKQDGEVKIINQDSKEKEENEKSNNFQKVFKPNNNTIYNN